MVTVAKLVLRRLVCYQFASPVSFRQYTSVMTDSKHWDGGPHMSLSMELTAGPKSSFELSSLAT